MPVLKNILRKSTSPYQGLKDFDVFIDTTDNKYFNVSDFPEELTLGNSSFLIEGSELLKNGVVLKIEVLDSSNNVVFHTPVDEYLEGTARRVSIEAYSTTKPGPATLTILGELDPSKIDVPVSLQNTYNVRYTKNFFFNTTKLNTRPIMFYGQPIITASEKVIGVTDSVQTSTTQTLTGTVELNVNIDNQLNKERSF
jgi:hypothetical protein|tara:strand:- start:1149 stop:1739 length:591 start_codon:yes stop_codon:yes gene_type:complete